MHAEPPMGSAAPTGGRLLARNTLWNLIGQAGLVAAAFVSIPFIIRGIGPDRFGVLSLIWALIGYMGLLDLGLGRALTQMVARKLGSGDERNIPKLVWTSVVVMFVLGVAGAVGLIVATPWATAHLLRVPSELRSDAVRSLYVLAFAVPAVVVSAALMGLLEALQRFQVINLLWMPAGIASYVGAALIMPFSRSLVAVVAVLVVARNAMCIGLGIACGKAAPTLWRWRTIDLATIPPLVRFGGWMTVSNVISPLLVSLDRFLIAGTLSVAAVAYYATPLQAVSTLGIVPDAMARVLFPAFALSLFGPEGRLRLLYQRGVKYTYLALFPLVVIIVSFAPEILRVWLGDDFADQGTGVMRWLAVGVLFNSLARMPFALIQGAGRPDVTAKVHAIELPLYVVLLWWAMTRFGLVGAAAAWTARMAVDTTALFLLASRVLPDVRGIGMRLFGPVVLAVAITAAVGTPHELLTRAAVCGAVLAVFGSVAWRAVMAADEKRLILTRMGMGVAASIG